VISPSRALEDKKGDQQARAELLAKLLAASGERPFMLKHGAGEDLYFIVMLTTTDLEAGRIQKNTGKPVVTVTAGKHTLMALQLEPELAVGELQSTYYEAKRKRWSATISLTRFQ